MKTFPILAVAALGALVGCDTLQNMNPMGGGGQATLDSMKKQPTANMLQLPPNAKVGTWWEHTAGGVAKMKYCVVAEQDGKFIVENPMDVGGTMIINASLVDPSVDLTKAVQPGEMINTNVSKAWIGLEGKEPVERPVMKAMKMPEPTGDAPKVDVEQGTETVQMAGQSWNSTWSKVATGKSWTVTGTAFPLKAEANGKLMMELTGWGDDAKPMLDWK